MLIAYDGIGLPRLAWRATPPLSPSILLSGKYNWHATPGPWCTTPLLKPQELFSGKYNWRATPRLWRATSLLKLQELFSGVVNWRATPWCWCATPILFGGICSKWHTQLHTPSLFFLVSLSFVAIFP
ncbi:hypothetical protein AHAS_Ahas13G0288400 [Arachis hypogaea]